MKNIEQFRYSAEPRSIQEGMKPNQPQKLMRSMLIDGSFLQGRYPILRMGIKTIPGIKFYVDSISGYQLTDGNGEWSFDCINNKSNSPINNVRFDQRSLREIINNKEATLVITVVYEG